VGIESIYMVSPYRYGTWFADDHKFALPVPDYPWPGFSNPDSSHYSGEYKLGRPIIPPLEISTSKDATNVRKEMEEYIEEGIQGLNVIENFEHQFDIIESEKPNATVVFGEGETLVQLEYPFNMTHKGTGNKKTLKNYQIELPIDFRTFYTFIEEALYQETSDLNFNINNEGHLSQLSSYKNEFRVSITELDNEFDLVMFIYNQTHGGDYMFRSIRQNRIPTMYELQPKSYNDIVTGDEVPYEIDEGIDLNFHHDSSEGFVEHDDSILEYILDPETVEQAIDPDELDELTFTYGKEGDCIYDTDECPAHDSIEFEVDENTGEFKIKYPRHHINLVNYTCETRVFVSDQADAEVKDYESVYFQHTGRECIGITQGVCYECCLDGCGMDETCHPPNTEGICDQSKEDTINPDSFDRGDSDYSFDKDDIDYSQFLTGGERTSSTWTGDCLEWEKCCVDTDDEGDCISWNFQCICVEREVCCDYCANPCGPGCETY